MPHVEEALRLRQLGLHPIVEQPNSKAPLAKEWQRQVNRTLNEVRADFLAAPAGSGVGTVTEGFIVLDLDLKRNISGYRSLLDLQANRGLPELPPTLISRTPSGGQHAFFRIPEGVRIKNSVSKLGPGIDIRGTGGQVVLPPTVLRAGRYTWQSGCGPNDVEMADLPEAWLTLLEQAEEPAAPAAPAQAGERVYKPGDREFAAERARRYLATVEPAVAGEGGHDATFRAACRATELCINYEDVLTVMREWNERCDPPWTESELAHKLNDAFREVTLGSRFEAPPREEPEAEAPAPGAPAAPSPVQDVAWVEEMQAYVVRDRRTGTWNLSNPLTKESALGALVSRGVSAPRARQLLKDWLVPYASRIECDPDSPPTFEVEGVRVLNNYVPPRVQPAGGACPVLDEVLAYITAGDKQGERWLRNWLANAYQHPARPMRTVPVFYGAQRTGKSLLGRVMTELLGQENCASIRNDDMKGRFNSHFVGKLFLTLGEVETADVADATARLKWLTGEPVLMAEAKGATAFQVKNRAKAMLSSNQTQPVAVEGSSDTRFTLFKQLSPPDPAYQARMDSLFDPRDNSWSAKGLAELQAFAWGLKCWEVDAELARSVHANEARQVAVEASRGSAEQFVEAVRGSSLDAVWLQYVQEHERTNPGFAHMDLAAHPELTGSAAVYATYRAFCRASGLQALGMGRFPGELERHAPEWRRFKTSGAVPGRPWVYAGVPRDRAGRQAYLPVEMRQRAFALPPTPKEDPRADEVRAKLQGVLELEGEE